MDKSQEKKTDSYQMKRIYAPIVNTLLDAKHYEQRNTDVGNGVNYHGY